MWGNSVLNVSLCSRDQLWDAPPALLSEGILSLLSLSQSLCLSWSLLGADGSSKSWACLPSLALSICCCMVQRAWFLVPPLTVQQWQIGSLSHPHCPWWIQHSTQTSNVGVRLQFTVYGFQVSCVCVCGGVHSAQRLCWIIFLEWGGGMGRGAAHGAWC
jgi:hypothetical protein